MCSLTDRMCRASIPRWSKLVIHVARMQLFVYRVESSAFIDIVFITFPKVLCPTEELSYQTASESLLLRFGLCAKNFHNLDSAFRGIFRDWTQDTSHHLVSHIFLLKVHHSHLHHFLCDFWFHTERHLDSISFLGHLSSKQICFLHISQIFSSSSTCVKHHIKKDFVLQSLWIVSV